MLSMYDRLMMIENGCLCKRRCFVVASIQRRGKSSQAFLKVSPESLEQKGALL